MNARTFILLSGIAAVTAFGQGTFQNLDFESAAVVPIPGDPYGSVQFGPAFPGWSASYGAFVLSSTTPVLYNNQFLGTSTLALHDPSYNPLAISNYTALLQGGAGAGFPVALAQTALVPSNSLSLRFMARAFLHTPETFIVSMNGQSLPYVTLEDFGAFRIYGVDVSGFAGQTAELRFTQPSGPGLGDNLLLDNISFSTVSVPEPGTWALLTLGGALLGWGLRRHRK